jgi:urease accessory protein
LERLVEVRAAGEWPLAEERGTLTLAFEERHRRRMRIASDQGTELLLDLRRTVQLHDGDGVQGEQGGWWRVVAAPETVLEIRGRDPQHTARLAWHLGNRHCPTEIRPDGLRVRHDHVLEAMVTGLGATCRQLFVPFDPEGGAYAGGHVHGHGQHEP